MSRTTVSGITQVLLGLALIVILAWALSVWAHTPQHNLTTGRTYLATEDIPADICVSDGECYSCHLETGSSLSFRGVTDDNRYLRFRPGGEITVHSCTPPPNYDIVEIRHELGATLKPADL